MRGHTYLKLAWKEERLVYVEICSHSVEHRWFFRGGAVSEVSDSNK